MTYPQAINTADAKQPHMVASDILNIGADTPAEMIEDLNAYFAAFANPRNADNKPICTNCGAEMDGLMHALGVKAAWHWGIAHGEATCSDCGWPARGMHYIKDRHGEELLTIRNVFLPYHPDQVGKREEGA